jgi:hypothetical protein
VAWVVLSSKWTDKTIKGCEVPPLSIVSQKSPIVSVAYDTEYDSLFVIRIGFVALSQELEFFCFQIIHTKYEVFLIWLSSSN